MGKGMNKRGIQAFSLGIIFTVSVIGSYYFYLNNPSGPSNLHQAKSLLEKNGYTILTKTELQKLKEKDKQSKEQTKIQIKDQHKNQITTQENNNKSYHLQVIAGMSSGEIAIILAEQHIIENAQEFQQYLTTHHYETKVQLGSYNLTNKMNYEQIAKTITKSK